MRLRRTLSIHEDLQNRKREIGFKVEEAQGKNFSPSLKRIVPLIELFARPCRFRDDSLPF